MYPFIDIRELNRLLWNHKGYTVHIESSYVGTVSTALYGICIFEAVFLLFSGCFLRVSGDIG